MIKKITFVAQTIDMLLLGIDVGTSSIKVSVVDADTKKAIVSVQFPETERIIKTIKPGWAEQSPLQWWDDVRQAICKAAATKKYNPKDIKAVGIAYQMHGLVMIDNKQKVLRDSIIWCDSRAVKIGNTAFKKIGEKKCLTHLLNSPGNFTASKLAWVKDNEPYNYQKTDKIMLPGDYIALQLTGEVSTTVTALSEGIFWDFINNQVSSDILTHFNFDRSIIPDIKNVFQEHGKLSAKVAGELGLTPGIPISYKAGDQPNNALSLNVLNPGEVAATAGTSGVIYAVGDQLTYDPQSRVNGFAHVNHGMQTRIGTLLCINGCGIMNQIVKGQHGKGMSYAEMNAAAENVKAGSNGLNIFPFCNGAERMFNNELINTTLPKNINHSAAEIFRATQEGIAFAFRYGLDILKENGIHPNIIRAGKANMFLSTVFTEAFVNVTNTPVELYNSDGSVGAAIGAGIGAKMFTEKQAFEKTKPLQLIEPTEHEQYNDLYENWKKQLITKLEKL